MSTRTLLVPQREDGAIVIPDAFREALGFDRTDLLRITLRNGYLEVAPGAIADAEQGSPWLRDLYDAFAPVRAEAIEKGYTEDEINAAIDEAVAAARAGKQG